MKKCTNANRYKGIRYPKCNEGKPCDACKIKYINLRVLSPLDGPFAIQFFDALNLNVTFSRFTYDLIDPEIKSIVMAVRAKGFETLWSCAGYGPTSKVSPATKPYHLPYEIGLAYLILLRPDSRKKRKFLKSCGFREIICGVSGTNGRMNATLRTTHAMYWEAWDKTRLNSEKPTLDGTLKAWAKLKSKFKK